MAGVPSKYNRDQALEFQDFLNDLQDWEHSKDRNLKAQVHEAKKMDSSRSKTETVSTKKRLPQQAPMSEASKPSKHTHLKIPYGSNNGQQSGYLGNFDAIRSISDNILAEESSPNAASEKELGNDYFKQKKFKQAIDCYSRSIAFSPTSVAFANRAMAYLKIKRFEEAESDCTEALNLDDRYVKAYLRRATARKELGKFKASIEDSEFALRLEPNNQEIRKLYAETKALYEKEIINATTSAAKKSIEETQRVKIEESAGKKVQGSQSISQSSQRAGVPMVQSEYIEEASGGDTKVEIEDKGKSTEGSGERSMLKSHANISKENHAINSKDGSKSSVQELASRAASRAMEAAVKSITVPKSAYQFEVLWRGFSNDRGLQTRLLKAISPPTLPHLFKNALSAPLLIDMVKCIATIFVEEMDLAVSFLDNLSKVGRFDMIILCLSAADKSDLRKIWDGVFSNEVIPIEHAETLGRLRSKYCP